MKDIDLKCRKSQYNITISITEHRLLTDTVQFMFVTHAAYRAVLCYKQIVMLYWL